MKKILYHFSRILRTRTESDETSCPFNRTNRESDGKIHLLPSQIYIFQNSRGLIMALPTSQNFKESLTVKLHSHPRELTHSFLQFSRISVDVYNRRKFSTISKNHRLSLTNYTIQTDQQITQLFSAWAEKARPSLERKNHLPSAVVSHDGTSITSRAILLVAYCCSCQQEVETLHAAPTIPINVAIPINTCYQ